MAEKHSMIEYVEEMNWVDIGYIVQTKVEDSMVDDVL